MLRRLCITFLLLAGFICAQHRVDPRNIYNRVIAVVPFVGSGTPTDPKRPKYVPWPPSQDPNGIIAFSFEPTDDGSRAVVEFVARNRAALQAILTDTTATAFERGRAPKSTVETAIQQYRKDYTMDRFGVVMP
jgi:hypothetical protein